jgi:hypothetical protein
MGLKIFNALPVYIKQESDNPKKFESLLKKFCMRIHFIPGNNFTDCLKLNIHTLTINFIFSYVFLLYSCFTQYFLTLSYKDPL